VRILIGRYHEVRLKGGNRWRFVRQAQENARAILADLKPSRIWSEGPRLLASFPEEAGDGLIAQRAARIFGIQNFTIGRQTKPDLRSIADAAMKEAKRGRGETFRVSARRTDKSLAFDSMQIEREVGEAVRLALGLDVDLGNPQITIVVEVLDKHAYVGLHKLPGAGGLPIGTGGRALALLSGGIDSPVACYRMMGRGLRLDFVHFHSYPLLPRTSQDKALELASVLNQYQPRSKLMMVPFAEIQRQIVSKAARPIRVIVYRRMMMRIATVLALGENASAIVTGESLSQVASQTLDNLSVIERAAGLPVLRPLLGMDKQEIIDQARRLGTYETSIIPDQDCCALLTPVHPQTHAVLKQIEEAEGVFDIEAMVALVVKSVKQVILASPTAHESRSGAS
jgi:thiamine biosynthesis protein ThiI